MRRRRRPGRSRGAAQGMSVQTETWGRDDDDDDDDDDDGRMASLNGERALMSASAYIGWR